MPLAETSHHSQSSAKQLASRIALKTIVDWGIAETDHICTCKDDLALRVGDIRDWKKEAEVSLKLPKEAKKRDIDLTMEYDLGIPDDLKKDAAEEKLEKVMQETYGYRLHMPEDDIEDDDNLQPPAEPSQTAASAGLVASTSFTSSVSSVRIPPQAAHIGEEVTMISEGVSSIATNLMDLNEPEMIHRTGLQKPVKPTARPIWAEDSDEEKDEDDCLLITTSGEQLSSL